jgi:CheY-like chemotaxis protein
VLEELLVLVIEDDPEIQALIDEALCDGGYEPALAASGEEAITLLKGRLTNYRVLVTDISLAGTADGWEVARIAREIDPKFPVIYMTGAAADPMARPRCAEQHSVGQTIRSRTVGDRHFPAAQHRRPAGSAQGVRPPQLAASFVLTRCFPQPRRGSFPLAAGPIHS